MKILLSAYACEPNKGSEPGVGWHWALEIARMDHEVWVLTRANNRSPIEAELSRLPTMPNLHFLYYDLPARARWWKRGQRGVHLYYFLWQWGAYRLAKRIHSIERFDRVHHVTFVSARQPSFMGNLGIPFVFGPVAGGERAPWHLRAGYGLQGWLADGVRDLANFQVKIDPLVRRTFKQAERIYVTSEQTLSLLPRRYRTKASVQLAIGIDATDMPFSSGRLPASCADRGGFSLLYVGRLLYLKGMHLGLPAFAHLLEKQPDARLTIVGDGPDKWRWQGLANKLGVAERINWIPWRDRKELSALYAYHDAFLFPSLHDSGGMVVLEAMAHGLPVVCLDLGGPSVMVDETCGRVIETKGKHQSVVIASLADALVKLAESHAYRFKLGMGAIQRSQLFTWSATVDKVYRCALPLCQYE